MPAVRLHSFNDSREDLDVRPQSNYCETTTSSIFINSTLLTSGLGAFAHIFIADFHFTVLQPEIRHWHMPDSTTMIFLRDAEWDNNILDDNGNLKEKASSEMQF